MVIKRYIEPEYLERLMNDFAFLPSILSNLYGEIEMSLRDNYFNLYYRGNSIAKVMLKQNGQYEVTIYKEFYNETSAAKRFKNYVKQVGDQNYVHLLVSKELLHPLLQRKHLLEFCAKIKNRNYSEELVLEQLIISDNAFKNDLIIIDRQVTDTILKGRMDLLALKQHQDNMYNFWVLEVKMGNNPDLTGNVANQLKRYVNHIKNHFADYKTCYEENYRQKKLFGLIERPKYENIQIVPGVEGMVVVSGYSGLANTHLERLRQEHPSLKIKQFSYELTIE